MKEITGDDYPTYEESVNMTLADREKKADFHRLTKQEFLDSYSYLTEEEYNLTMNQIRLLQEEKDISKNNMQRLLRENLELKHRLACIADDIELIDRHIKNNCNKEFKRPSLNSDGSTYADEAWHNVSNIEIACDLTDDEPMHWGSKVKFQLDELDEQN